MGILDTAKEIVTLVQKLDNIDLMKQVLDLQGQIADVLEEKRELREKNLQLEELLKVSKNLSFKPPFYFATADQVPFCPRCWEVDQKAVHLKGPVRVNGMRWDCPQCNQVFLVQTEEERTIGSVRRSVARFRRS